MVWKMPQEPSPQVYKDLLSATMFQIQSPSQWCKGAWARDMLGRSVPPLSASACQWCAGGALMKFTALYLYAEHGTRLRLWVHSYCKDKYGCSLGAINDGLGHSKVMEVLKEMMEVLSYAEKV